MNQSDKLTFCKFCNNRLFNKDSGLICNLTSSKPSFDSKCENFNIDEDEISNARKGRSTYRFISEKDTEYILPENIFIKKKIKPISELKLYKKVLFSWEFNIMIVAYLFLPPILNSFLKMNVLILAGLFTALLIMGILTLRRKFKEKPYLEVTKDYFVVEGNIKIAWNRIIRYYFSSYLDLNQSNPIFTRTIKTLYIESFGHSKPFAVDISGTGRNLRKLGLEIENIKKQCITTHQK